MSMTFSDDIKVIQWYEHPMMKGVKEALEKELPGWKFQGPYCPGKPGHHSFKATLGEESCKWVHVHDQTLEISYGNPDRVSPVEQHQSNNKDTVD